MHKQKDLVHSHKYESSSPNSFNQLKTKLTHNSSVSQHTQDNSREREVVHNEVM